MSTPPERRAQEVAREWLRRARSNLARAKQPKPPEAFWEDLCFDAQQAAEKAVKAALVFHRIDFPRTHRIGELLALLEESGREVPQDIWGADRLSPFATVARYPDNPNPADEAMYRDAVSVAEVVVAWAEGALRG